MATRPHNSVDRRGGDCAYGPFGVVGEPCSVTNENGPAHLAKAVGPHLSFGPRNRPGARVFAASRSIYVACGILGPLERDERATLAHRGEKSAVLKLRFVAHETKLDVSPYLAKHLDSPPRNQRIRVFMGNHDSLDSGRCNGEAARPGTPRVAAGFERNVHRGRRNQVNIFCRHRPQCHDLGMWFSSAVVVAFANHASVVHDYGSNEGVGMRKSLSLSG